MIVPRDVILAFLGTAVFVPLIRGEIMRGIEPLELAGMDPVYEQVADIDAVLVFKK